MHSTGSLLYTTIERIRAYLDDPSVDAKYSNDYLIRHVIYPEMVNVMGVLNSSRDEPIIITFDLSTMGTSGDLYFELPPTFGSVIRIAKLDADANVVDDVEARDPSDPRGPGWTVEGRELHVRPSPGAHTAYRIWYIPTGDFLPHYSAGGGTLTSSNVLTLDSTFSGTDLGGLDMREHAYVGGLLRVWNAGKTIVEERVITEYDVKDADLSDVSTVTCGRKVFTSDVPNASSLQYEIVPVHMPQVWQAVAIAAAMNLGTARNITEKQMAFLKEQFGMAIQSILATYGDLIKGKQVYPENSVLYTMLQRVRWGLPPDIEGELSNDYIMRSAVVPKIAEVMSAVNDRSDAPIVVRFTPTLVSGTEYYAIPTNIQKILRVAEVDATPQDDRAGLVSSEIRHRSDNDPHGHGWKLEGPGRLSIRPYLNTGSYSDTYAIWYIPNGDVQPHYAKDGTIGGTGTTLTLTSGGLFSRQLGTVDRRASAYTGSVARVWNSSGLIEERVITDYDATNKRATFSERVTASTATSVEYEIVPSWMTTMSSAVVSASVLSLSALKGKLQEADLAVLTNDHNDAMKATISNVRSIHSQKVVASKHSILHGILEKIRGSLETVAPDLDYSDDYIFRHGIVPEYGRVMSRLNNTASNPVYATHSFTLVKDQQFYQLPASVGEILRIVEVNDDGRIEKEPIPRTEFHWRGPNWSVQGNRLSFRPYPKTTTTYEVWYIPSYDITPHYAEDGDLSAGRTNFTLTGEKFNSGLLGSVDRREGAYHGCMVRILTESGALEERVITDSTLEPSAGAPPKMTVAAFSTDINTTTEDAVYEVVPAHMFALQDAIAASGTLNLAAASKSVTKVQHGMLVHNFKAALKTVMDNFTFMQNRIPKHYEKGTVDNTLTSSWVYP